MNQIDLLNMYWDLLFNCTADILRYLFESYDHFSGFKKWCLDNDKKINFVRDMSYDEYVTLKKAPSVNVIDSFLKTNYEESLNEISEVEKKKYHIVFLPGINKETLKKEFFDIDYINQFKKDNYSLYHFNEELNKDDLSLYGPFVPFMQAIYQIDKWPGILVFKGEEAVFKKVNNTKDVQNVFEEIENNTIFKEQKNNDDYIIQLSDLHLGTKKHNEGLDLLYESLDDLIAQLHTPYKIKFLITGDLMNSPNRPNMYLASSFMNKLKKDYHGDVTFILGNHDVIVHGFNLLHRQKTKVVAYLLGENIKVLEDEKIILIKMDSTSEGNLARGKVGTVQLKEIEEELDAIDNLDDYTLCVMIHHHLFPIVKDDFLKTKWSERIFVGKFMDTTKALQDADDVIEFIRKHQIKYVFHGHKHIPYIFDVDGIHMMAGGSACGGGVKEHRSRYLNYNILKYDRNEKSFKYCLVVYDDLSKLERHRLKINMLED